MQSKAILSLVVTSLIFLSACSSTSTIEPVSTSSQATPTVSSQPESMVNSSDMFTDSDLEIGYDEETSAVITLSGNSASTSSDAVKISGTTVTIADEGTYILSGTLTDGMILVDVADTQKVHLILDGVQITNSTSAAIYVLEADKVFITTTSDSENTLTNGGEYIAIDDNNIDAVIFSKSDLTMNGAGTLSITATAGHGIVSKDDLVITSGSYNITAASHGISGKDSVRIANGTYKIVSGKDGIHAENADDADLGFLYIAGGTFEITSEGDGMSASGYLLVQDGSFTIHTGEGSSSVAMEQDTMMFGRNGDFQTQSQTTEEDTSTSQKGIKANGAISIMDGNFTTDTVDDSIHAGGDILIVDGIFELHSGDDAVHSDAAVTLQNGIFNIPLCYEGIEGLSVTIDNGTFDITSVDDGINAAGGADSSGFGGKRPGQEQFSASSDSFITINGGTFVIVSTGDCIDSNGNLTVSGGTLNLTCNSNGNTTLDCDGTYEISNSNITTNDGAESNPNQMGGGKSNMGQGRRQY